uniref:Uncharacterized protein n=1 Tax=Setaria viridis TaxID=4556 RepID=A0A4U6W1E6_SETVI|nr:hypothetical protein SEVIR_2G396750v2 [Setaria viridis]
MSWSCSISLQLLSFIFRCSRYISTDSGMHISAQEKHFPKRRRNEDLHQRQLQLYLGELSAATANRHFSLRSSMAALLLSRFPIPPALGELD